MPNGPHLISASAPVKRPIRRSAGTGWSFGTAAVIYASFLQHATQPPFLTINRVHSFPGDGQWRRQEPLDPGFGEVALGREVAVVGHLHRLAVVPALLQDLGRYHSHFRHLTPQQPNRLEKALLTSRDSELQLETGQSSP